ncbi:MAG TPA: hypothetical protein ENK57_22285 [Polyangiaceae bacterium]|nr:hypothetical protein [Polyangiaceae bacterium]
MSLQTIELTGGFVEVEIRPGHLFVVATGQLNHMSDFQRYTAMLDAIVQRSGRPKVLLDARGEVGRPPAEVKEAMWRWLTDEDRAIGRLAYVLATDRAVEGVNAIAEERGASVRAFATVGAASAWLLRDTERAWAPTEPRALEPRPPEPQVKALSTNPPTGRRQRLSPGGAYQASDAPADHVGGGSGSSVA